MAIKIGERVYYFPACEVGSNPHSKGSPYPAIVTHVWGETTVNLSVCNDASYPLGPSLLQPTSVTWQPANTPRTSDYWTFPHEYQE